MKNYLLLFVCILMMSCKASYPWYALQVFQSTFSPHAGTGIENIILRYGGIFISCVDNNCNGRYFYTGTWKIREGTDTLVLTPKYRYDTENVENVMELIPSDSTSVSDCYLDYAIPRVFLIRRRFLREVTDYSIEFYENGKLEKYKDHPEQRRVLFKLINPDEDDWLYGR